MEKKSSTTSPESANNPASENSEPVAPVVESGDTVTTGVAADEPVTVVMKPPKKNRGGLIAIIVVLILLVLSGGAFAIWYFAVYSNPDNVAYDALRQLVSAPNVITNGTVEIVSEQTGDTRVVASLDFDTSSMRVPTSTDVKISFSERDKNDKIVDDHLIELNLGTAILADGDIYFRVSDAMKALDQISDSSESALDEYGEIGAMAYDIIEIIDNEWWQISLDDLVSTLDIKKSEAQPALDFYDCVLNIAKSDWSGEIATLFKDHRFMHIEKVDRAASESGRSVYGILDIQHEELADFINALPETASAEAFYACYNEFARDVNGGGEIDELSARDFDEVTASEITEAMPDDFEAYFEISNFGHRLYKMNTTAKDDDDELTVDLSFDYSDARVSAPDKYRPITDLVDEISEIIAEHLSSAEELWEEDI